MEENSTLNKTGGHECSNSPHTNEFDRWSWVIAVILAVFAALFNNFGVNLQKLAWTKKQNGTVEESVYKMYWIMGLGGIILASLFDFAALAFGPQSVIAPLGSLTMAANAIIAPWMHGEKLHKNVLSATIIIIIGCVISVGSASHSNDICGVDALFALYSTSRFVIYAVIISTMLVAGTLGLRRCEEIQALYGDASREYQRVFKFHRFGYAAISGVFGAQSVLFAKSVDELLVATTRGGKNFLMFPGTYIVTGCMAGSIALQIYWLNLGLARFESLYNVPVFTATWIVFTSIAGGVMFGEFAQFSSAQAFLFPFGVLLCCIGVYRLSSSDAQDSAQVGDLADPYDLDSLNGDNANDQADLSNRGTSNTRLSSSPLVTQA